MAGSMVDSGIVDSGSDGQERLDRLVGTLVAVFADYSCRGGVGGEAPRPAFAGEGWSWESEYGAVSRSCIEAVARLVAVWVSGSE